MPILKPSPVVCRKSVCSGEILPGKLLVRLEPTTSHTVVEWFNCSAICLWHAAPWVNRNMTQCSSFLRYSIRWYLVSLEVFQVCTCLCKPLEWSRSAF